MTGFAVQDRKRYRGFSKSVADLLVPSFPGSLPSVARNLFNAVFLVDLASEQGLRLVPACDHMGLIGLLNLSHAPHLKSTMATLIEDLPGCASLTRHTLPLNTL